MLRLIPGISSARMNSMYWQNIYKYSAFKWANHAIPLPSLLSPQTTQNWCRRHLTFIEKWIWQNLDPEGVERYFLEMIGCISIFSFIYIDHFHQSYICPIPSASFSFSIHFLLTFNPFGIRINMIHFNLFHFILWVRTDAGGIQHL